MIAALAKTIFGSANDRYVRSSSARSSRRSTPSSRPSRAMTDDELRGQTDLFRQRLADGRQARRSAARSLRDGPRGRQADARPAPLRRPDDRRHRPPPRRDRRDADRRGQDAGRDAGGLSERACRARASMSSPSTTISPSATPTGWARSTRFLGLTVGVIVPNLTDRRAPRRLSMPTSPTRPTTSSASTICATI